MKIGIILVHGYTGAKEDLAPIYDHLCLHFDEKTTISVSLHPDSGPKAPEFAQADFESKIADAAGQLGAKTDGIVFIGHSTGGTLILSCLKRFNLCPALLILAGTPKKVDMGFLERWESHATNKEKPALTQLAKLISMINTVSKYRFPKDFPVLLLAGEKDELVPPATVFEWKSAFCGQVRRILLPGGTHHFFQAPDINKMPADLITRAVKDAFRIKKDTPPTAVTNLLEVEPEALPFLSASPGSVYHFAQTPGVRRIVNQKYDFPPVVSSEPVFANVEITTHCQLSCRFCIRTRQRIKPRHMSLDSFSQVLFRLPHAYRITLVGLGEPLLHPKITDIIRMAKDGQRRVAVVTNAMALDSDLSERLIAAGLDSIAFSLDGHSQELSEELRPGTNIPLMVKNIKQFVRLAENAGRPISTAVFSAVSKRSLPDLKKLTDLVSKLGVHVLMLSDLNFGHNAEERLWNNLDGAESTLLKQAVGNAFSKGLPVLSVRGIEEFGLWKRYKDYLAVPVSQIHDRSQTHSHCLSPWQTIPVDVEGNVSICDCQPDQKIGNIFRESLSDIWNGIGLRKQREQMISKSPPFECQCCPRF